MANHKVKEMQFGTQGTYIMAFDFIVYKVILGPFWCTCYFPENTIYKMLLLNLRFFQATFS